MPAKLTSMAKTPRERQDDARPWEERAAEEMPDYPYGLSINLEYESMQKLGLVGKGLKPGDKLTITAVGSVTSARAEMINGINEQSVSIQLQEMATEPVDEAPDARSNILFGSPTVRT